MNQSSKALFHRVEHALSDLIHHILVNATNDGLTIEQISPLLAACQEVTKNWVLNRERVEIAIARTKGNLPPEMEL